MAAASPWSVRMSIPVILVSQDPNLVAAVREAVEASPGCYFTSYPTSDDARLHCLRDHVELLIVNIAEGSSREPADELLRELSTSRKSTRMLVISDTYRAEDALALLRHGAVDYLARPLELGRLAYLINVLTLRTRCLGGVAKRLQHGSAHVLQTGASFLFGDRAMRRLIEQVRAVSAGDSTVLLEGETGTGKSCLARMIHELSPRRDDPFLVVSCTGMPESLVDSVLFGHTKGAFTSAESERTGKFAAAGSGTILLDDVDSLPLSAQGKLLQVVEDRTYEPVGSNKTRVVQARILAASNRNLKQEVSANRFRGDLYYRLNVVGFRLPPLRERRELLSDLVLDLITQFSRKNNKVVRGLAADCMRAIETYDWPGNIREMRNAIERGVTLCTGTELTLDDLPDSIRFRHHSEEAVPVPSSNRDGSGTGPERASSGEASGSLAEAIHDAELKRIRQALDRNKNNRQRAALDLGISRMTLYKKLHKYGII